MLPHFPANSSKPSSAPLTPVTISTAFYQTAVLPGAEGWPPDIVLHTSDNYFFYVHSFILFSRSSNGFGDLYRSLQIPPTVTVTGPSVPTPQTIITPVTEYNSGFLHPTHYPPPSSTAVSSGPSTPHAPLRRVPESAPALTILLHVVYGMSFSRYSPDLEQIAQALDSMEFRGVPIPFDPQAEIWRTLLSLAPQKPLRAFSIAASHGAELVCMLASRFTLRLTMAWISEADALTMGPAYLRRLGFMHIGRREALLRVMRAPPHEHAANASNTCSASSRSAIQDAWKVAVARAVTNPLAHGTTAAELIEVLGPVFVETGRCHPCWENLRARIGQVTADWTLIKDTI